jgi:hypothetical protein
MSNGSPLALAPGLAAPVSMSGFTNKGSGSISVGAATTVNVADFETAGVLTLAPATSPAFTQLTNTGTSPLFFNGGSRTFIGTPATAGTFVAGIDLNGQNAIVAGGLLVNNGYIVDLAPGAPGRVVADFGALVKGAGFYQNPVVTQNGGKFQAGNSPGTARFGSFTFGPGGVDRYLFSINDADGIAGQSSGFVEAVRQAVGGTMTAGDFAWTADPGNRLTVALETLAGLQAGPMAAFDPTQPYAWPAVTWAGTYTGPADAATLTAATAFETSGFVNSVGGVFGWSLDTGARTLSLTYTPVPEPGALALVAGGLVVGWMVRRRRAGGSMAAANAGEFFRAVAARRG